MHYLRRSLDPREQYRRWIDPRLRSLQLYDVVAYLEGRGWKPLPPDRPGLRAFQEPGGAAVDGRPVCQFVPDSEAYDNYAQLMFELITGVAEIRGSAGQGSDRRHPAARPARRAEWCHDKSGPGRGRERLLTVRSCPLAMPSRWCSRRAAQRRTVESPTVFSCLAGAHGTSVSVAMP